MSIKEGAKKINPALASASTETKSFQGLLLGRLNYKDGFFNTDFYVVLIIILVGLSSFGLGRLATLEESRLPVYLEKNQNLSASALDASKGALGNLESVGEINQTGTLVASRNGSKYHFPWCSGAQRMKEENKIWFDSESEARKAGYSPAANCKGLK